MSKVEWYVQIIEDDSINIEKQMGPFSARRAEKVADGVSINLNHDRFSVVVVSEEGAENVQDTRHHSV